jgi:hypothetical protein
MITTLTDEELIQLGYHYNINKTYLFKTFGGFSGVFVDTKTRKVDLQGDRQLEDKIIKELKIKE